MDENVNNGQNDQAHEDFYSDDGTVFSYDRGSRLYKKNSQPNEHPRHDQEAQTQLPTLVDAHVRRDTFAFTISTIIALATYLIIVIYTYYAARQVNASEGANYAALKAIRESGHAAGNALEEAKKALTQSRDQFIQDERPYMWTSEPVGYGFIHPQNTNSGANSGKIACDVIFKNYGKSPAIKVRSYTYISTNVPDPENDIDWSTLTKVEGVYPPGATFTATSRSVTPTEG